MYISTTLFLLELCFFHESRKLPQSLISPHQDIYSCLHRYVNILVLMTANTCIKIMSLQNLYNISTCVPELKLVNYSKNKYYNIEIEDIIATKRCYISITFSVIFRSAGTLELSDPKRKLGIIQRTVVYIHTTKSSLYQMLQSI